MSPSEGRSGSSSLETQSAEKPQSGDTRAQVPGGGQRPRTLTDRIISATVAIAVAHLAAKLLGLIQARVIGHYYGFSDANDAFVLAFEGVIWTLFLVGEESLGPAVLPVFMSAREKDTEDSAWRFVSTLFNLQFMLLAVAVALLMAFPEHAIQLLSEFSDQGRKADRSRLAVEFLSGMAPALIGLSLGSLTYMVMNGYKMFFWPAFADALLKLGMVVGIVAGQKLGFSNEALIVGVLSAGGVKILVHLGALGGKLRQYRPVLDFSNPHLKTFLLLVAPLLVGILFAKVRDYYNYYYIVSALESGMLSVNSYGRKLYTTLGWLVPYPLSIAMFPFFVELVARDDRQALGDFLTRSSRMLLLVFMPVSLVIVVLSIPLAQAMFQTGQVSGAEAALAGKVNACYIIVLPFYALEYVFIQAYFSTHRTISVTLIGIVFSTVSMAISYVGVRVLNLTGPEAVMAVALGFTISRALKTCALAAVLKMKGLPLLPFRETTAFFFRVAVLTGICGTAAYGALQGVERLIPSSPAPAAAQPAEAAPAEVKKAEEPVKKASDAPEEPQPKQKAKESGTKALLRALPKLAIPGIVAGLVFLIGCKLLRLTELNEMIGYAREKFRRRKQKKIEPTAAA